MDYMFSLGFISGVIYMLFFDTKLRVQILIKKQAPEDVGLPLYVSDDYVSHVYESHGYESKVYESHRFEPLDFETQEDPGLAHDLEMGWSFW